MPGRRAARVICHPFFSLSLSLYFICLPFLLLIFFSFTFFFFWRAVKRVWLWPSIYWTNTDGYEGGTNFFFVHFSLADICPAISVRFWWNTCPNTRWKNRKSIRDNTYPPAVEITRGNAFEWGDDKWPGKKGEIQIARLLKTIWKIKVNRSHKQGPISDADDDLHRQSTKHNFFVMFRFLHFNILCSCCFPVVPMCLNRKKQGETR